MANATETTEPVKRTKREPEDITRSADDTRLYDYNGKDSPLDVVINVGNGPVMVAAAHAVADSQRIEVGDRRRGAYYLTVLGRLPGLVRLNGLDQKRLDAVNKIRDIRIGKREADWIVAARKRSAEQGGNQPLPHNPLSDESPVARAARAL